MCVLQVNTSDFWCPWLDLYLVSEVCEGYHHVFFSRPTTASDGKKIPNNLILEGGAPLVTAASLFLITGSHSRPKTHQADFSGSCPSFLSVLAQETRTNAQRRAWYVLIISLNMA